MNLSNETIEKLSEKFARQFTYRMASSAHLIADLKQEAAIAIFTHSPRWRADGGANLETFTRIYAWRAMQELCTRQRGPVSKPMRGGHFEGTRHGSAPADDDRMSAQHAAAIEDRSQPTPESILERREADEIVRGFIERRAERFNGKGKLSLKTIKNALRDLISGDTCTEVGQRYGVSKQYVSVLAAEAEIA